MNFYKKAFLVFFLSVIINNVFIAAEEEGKYLRWKKVEGASGYLVEIKKGERLVQSSETEESSIPLDLIPGEYSYKITVYNKFKKVIAESGWRVLSIEAAAQPFIRKFEPESIYLSEKTLLLRVSAYNVTADSVFSLKNSDKSVTGKTVSSENNVFTVEFDSEGLSPGDYSVAVENKAGFSDSSIDFLVVKIPLMPVIDSIDKPSLESGYVYSDITINGKGFEEGIILEFRSGDTVIKPSSVQYVSPERLIVIADLSAASPGDYSVYAENPSGLSDVFKKRLEVLEKTAAVTTGDAHPPVKKDLFTIHGGLAYGYMLDNYTDYHNYNYWGVTTRLQLDFNTALVNKFEWLSPIGAEFVFDYYPKDINFYEIGINVYYKSRFDSPVNFIIRGGGGISIFDDIDHSPESGRFIQGTFGIALKFLKFIYMDFSAGPKTWVVEGDYMNYLISSATFGYTF